MFFGGRDEGGLNIKPLAPPSSLPKIPPKVGFLKRSFVLTLNLLSCAKHARWERGKFLICRHKNGYFYNFSMSLRKNYKKEIKENLSAVAKMLSLNAGSKKI